ncbi:hypothetical protein [Microbacterium sp. T32]|uniref:hypothetical protein n=2 Tax=Bacteria TaxID=2 RepID=UPI0007AB5C94|nr:hypothetical protein [Microbacterium sp. T32]KZE41625.1 hypothetical protein AVW09_03345 [Microbacterium sp. T32]
MPSPTPAQAAEATLVLGLPVEVLALVVASFGLFASLGALVWQFTKHVLDGGRVKVYLNAGVWEPSFALRINRSGRFALRPDDDTAATFRDNFEVAQLVIENPGRTAVTVYSPGLAIGGAGAKDHSLTPRTFELPEGFGADRPSTANVVRLEPYDRVSFLFDYWSVVPGLLEKASSRGITVRGFVSVAGRTNRPQKSSWRKRWRIPQGAYTAIVGSPRIAPFTVLWRKLWRDTPEKDDIRDEERFRVTPGMTKYLLERAMRKFDAAPDRDTFMDVLEAEARKMGDEYAVIHTGVFEGYRSLERLSEHLGPWNWVLGKEPAVERLEAATPAEAQPGAAVEDAPPSTPPSRRAARAQRAD